MIPKNLIASLSLMAAAAVAMPALADDGHNHGDEAPAAASGPASPRFTAVSETFELVGVVNGRQLTLYLDHFADNSPVKDAELELEVGGSKVSVERHADGEYEATLAQELTPGVVAVTATVVAGNQTDLLAGELDVHEEAHADEVHERNWRGLAGWAAAAAIVIAVLYMLVRAAARGRRTRAGGAA